MASNPAKPFITCHVLDTTSGKPGPSIKVQLKLLHPASTDTTATWSAKTNNDGRVVGWEADSSATRDLNTVVEQIKAGSNAHSSPEEQMVFSLTFDTESYFGKGKTFWPEVELRFAAKMNEAHYHVPLLLGPWSYTTYRGS